MDAITMFLNGYVPPALTPALRDESSGILILLYLVLCQLIVLGYMLPAKEVIIRFLKDSIAEFRSHIHHTHK